MKKFAIILFLLFAFCILLSTFYISSANINPSSPLYFLKAVKEVLELKFAKTTQAKAIRQLEFATSRISEVKSLSDISRQDLIEPTLEKYARHLEKLNGNENLIAQLNVLQEVFKIVSDPSAKRSIRLAIFRLSEKFTSIKPVACSFISKEASSAVLSEVEKFVYTNRTKECLK